eukprot:TRINITY_DN7443_c0_g1_i1.p1 TRINITY_DN7443_c0_g1~~TRINITY_DN7443_c0_g1_i1.p1  ORF type:complete len:387 (-),score=28.10 TRINITY_DN7443_c0_g1_i1:277-1416(-)
MRRYSFDNDYYYPEHVAPSSGLRRPVRIVQDDDALPWVRHSAAPALYSVAPEPFYGSASPRRVVRATTVPDALYSAPVPSRQSSGLPRRQVNHEEAFVVGATPQRFPEYVAQAEDFPRQTALTTHPLERRHFNTIDDVHLRPQSYYDYVGKTEPPLTTGYVSPYTGRRLVARAPHPASRQVPEPFGNASNVVATREIASAPQINSRSLGGLFSSLAGSSVAAAAAQFAEGTLSGTASKGGPSIPDISSALKEALKEAVGWAVRTASASGGFLNNTNIKIPWPAEAAGIEKVLRRLGLGVKCDELVRVVNQTAEQSSGRALEIFVRAVTSMSITDAKGILQGHDKAATEYMQRSTTEPLKGTFGPVVNDAMEQFAVTKVW